jgi:hypothetical protein
VAVHRAAADGADAPLAEAERDNALPRRLRSGIEAGGVAEGAVGRAEALHFMSGFASSSKLETVAGGFAKNAMFCIDIPALSFGEAMPGRLYVGCGCDVTGFSHFASEQEVVLTDATPLRIRPCKFDKKERIWYVAADLDLTELRAYYRIFDSEA